MKKFFVKSFFYVTCFSAIKFFLNLKLASLLMPSDYGIILIPLIAFSFLDILLDGGFHAGIIKFNANRSDLLVIFRKKLKLWFLFGPLTSIALYVFVLLTSLEIPLLVILSFMVLSLFRLTNYFPEAKLISEGQYIKTEVINFVITVFLYLSFIWLIPLYDLEGFYYLCVLNLFLYGLYGIILIAFARNISNDDQNTTFDQLNDFSKSVIQSNFIFNIGGRIDEIAASIIFSASLLGIYSRVKELGVMLGTFSSKIISRPWYYIACNLEKKVLIRSHFMMIGAMIFLVYVGFFLLDWGVFLIIDFMGPNWKILADYSDFILFVFLLYFLVIFTTNTLLALGKEKLLLKVDRVIIVLRIISYLGIFMTYELFDLTPSITHILYLEIIIRLFNFLVQFIIFFAGEAIASEEK